MSAEVSSHHGLSNGVIIAVAAVLASVVCAACAAVLLLLRHRARRRGFHSKAKQLALVGKGNSTADRLISSSSELSGSREIVLPFSDWRLEPSEIKFCQQDDGQPWLLGSGAFGKVYKATRGGVTVVAAKVLTPELVIGGSKSERLGNHAQKQVDDFHREVMILRSCRDRNIVQFLGACVTDDQLMLVTEYMEGGDLHTALEDDGPAPGDRKLHWYRPAQATGPEGKRVHDRGAGLGCRVAIDIARGLAFLHARKIVHLDLKTPNILLARDMTAKLADVGLARIKRSDALTTLGGAVGTYVYAAPEVLFGRACTEAVDIYSFGVVLWSISMGEAPSQRALPPLRVPADCPQAAADLVKACMMEDPAQRPTAVQIVRRLAQLGRGLQAGKEPLPEVEA